MGPVQYSKYGSRSKKLLNTDLIWIRIHNTVYKMSHQYEKVSEAESPRAANFKAAAETKPTFWSVGAKSRSRLDLFGKYEKKSLVLVISMNFFQSMKTNMIKKDFLKYLPVPNFSEL